jgi:hypothetical protein
VVKLRSERWSCPSSRPALATLEAGAAQGRLLVSAGHTNSFTIKFTFTSTTFEDDRTILEIANVVTVRLRQHNPRDRARQNYPAFPMPDGTVPVLEATLFLHSVEHPDWKEMVIGIPLAMVRGPGGEHEVILQFDGVHWQIYANGELLDTDFPFGYPQWPENAFWKVNPTYVKRAEVYVPGVQLKKQSALEPDTVPEIQFWTPRGHNNWVGDVETFFHQGRYHVFYLYDRRHHQSKFGCGAHYFEHLSTTDFKTWVEHEAATPLEDQWECIGTGVPFVANDQLCLSFGWHTTRVYPDDKTTLPAQREHLRRFGRSGTFHRATTPGMPAGSSYSISADGISQFRKSQVMFHPCENPSVYSAPNGQLRMLANYRSSGIWESDSVDGGWRCVNPTFPPGGDCTIFFRWGRFDYIIGGFTGLWRKPADAPDHAYEDITRLGLDFYDGSNVPAVTAIGDGRRLLAGWIPIRGWGGVLLLRELVQYPDGRIGSKWMNEVMPAVNRPVTLAERITTGIELPVKPESFLLSCSVHPEKSRRGRLGISFLDQQANCRSSWKIAGRSLDPSHRAASDPSRSLCAKAGPLTRGETMRSRT